jgi:SAM-dependent methyltransferase
VKEEDKSVIIDRYRSRLMDLGEVPGALGEPKCRQSFYYHFLLDSPEAARAKSILDVGCGYGDLGRYLERRGWEGHYVGIDIVPDLIEVGKRRYPKADLRCLDLEHDELDETFDWALAIGSLTSRMEHEDYYKHLESMIAAIWTRVNVGMSFNLFSPHVDFQSPVHFHPDIGRVCEIVARHTRRFTLRNDYMPFEYALFMYREDAVDRDLSIFTCYRRLFDAYKKETYGQSL